MVKDAFDLRDGQGAAGIDIKLQESFGMRIVENLLIRAGPEVEGDVARLNWRNGSQSFVVSGGLHVVDVRGS